MESKEQNKQSRNRLTVTENRLTAVREMDFGGWVKRVKVLCKKQSKKSHRDRQNMGMTRGEVCWTKIQEVMEK